MKKVCTSCKSELPVEDFDGDSRNRDGLKSSCKRCLSEYSKRYRKKNEEKLRVQSRDRYLRNKEVRLARGWLWKLKHRYGLTEDQYLDMLRKQDGLCMICGRPPRGKYRRLVVDHDHKTDRVRGLLCHECNKGLGIFEDRIDLLKAAVNYLQGELENDNQ